MEARFDRVRYPQPGQTLYEAVELSDAETGQWILRCRTLEVSKNGHKFALAPTDVEVSAAHAHRLVQLVVRRLTRELPGDEPVWFVPTNVTLKSASTAQTYEDVECRIESQAELAAAAIRFRLPEAEAGEAPVLSIGRQRGNDGATTTVRLDSYGSLLPVSIFRPWLDLRTLVGDHATFCGSVAVRQVSNTWSWEATGSMDGIDLEVLVAQRFPHHLAGVARLRIDEARFERGRLTAASGELACPAGTIGGPLLVAAVESLRCKTIELPGGRLPFAADKNHPFRELALRFRIDEGGLSLATGRDGQAADALLLDDRGDALLFPPSVGAVPLMAFIRALVPDSTIQVPATKETAALQSWLPLPSVVPPPHAGPAAPPLRIEAD